MKVGLYFGSFNPVHTGHLIIANHILNYGNIDQLWMVVSPQNPLKPSATLLNEYDRLHLLKVATEDDPRIKVSDIEFHLPKPSYTSITLQHLQEKHPNYTFSVIMGSDSYQNINKWHNYTYILENYSLLVYQRPGHEIEECQGTIIENAPLLEISATQIRTLIKEGKSIRYLVPESVKEEIEKGNLYKNILTN